MIPVYAIASNVITPLGFSVDEVWQAIETGRRGVAKHEDESLSPAPFYASMISDAQWQQITVQTANDKGEKLSLFERMALHSVQCALKQVPDLQLEETALILSTTKGNIEWLNVAPAEELLLSHSADVLNKRIGLKTKPIVVSHACVSGVTALQYGKRLLEAARYKNVIVVGADKFTRFVLSGFQSFQAIADGPCKPFDKDRTGINLGEAAATIILSTESGNKPLAQLRGGATTNDANHISGPSRTGAELGLAIARTLKEAAVAPEQVDVISAHGTATVYNDEMEAKAFTHARVAKAPLHSLKGYLGHTLGAAGVLESAMLIESLRRGQLIPSVGYETLGVSEQLNVTTQMKSAYLRYALKTASGFGGCNATILWEGC